MLRRLHADQPETFAFTPANQAWAEAQITKYPEGRQASAIIPLLWRAQEQEGWLTRPAIEGIADMLGMAYIRALEVASFYFMFQLQPTGSLAHIQICGTTSCMICGAEGLVEVCKNKIAEQAHDLSADGRFSWEEVECLGACANAPMAQIGKDYYEDLTPDILSGILDRIGAGEVPVPGPQQGRYAAEPASGLTSLTEYEAGKDDYNASARLAVDIGETIKRIDGTEVPLTAPWQGTDAPKTPKPAKKDRAPAEKPAPAPKIAEKQAEEKIAKPKPSKADTTPEAPRGTKPAALEAARDNKPDNLKLIKGIGPKLEKMLHGMGFFHFDQLAAWTQDELDWVDDSLDGFKGRATRDEWVAQAKVLKDK